MNDPSAHYLTYLIPLAIVVLVVRRNLRARRLRVERLWVLPTVIFAVTALSLASKPPTGLLVFIALPIALALGCLAGWYRGRFTRIIVDPATHELTSKPSPVALVLIAALFVVRYSLRAYLENNEPDGHGALGANATIVTDGLLLFSVGLMGVQRLEMWLRARTLLSKAIAARGAGL